MQGQNADTNLIQDLELLLKVLELRGLRRL